MRHGPALALAVVAFFSPWYGITGLDLTTMTLVCIYGIAATGVNLVFGYGGMLSLGGAIFMGIGAYTVAIAHLTFGWPVLAAAGLGIVLCALVAFLLGLLLVRLSGHYFGVATLGLSFAFTSLLLALPDVTGGGTGFSSFPELNLGITRLHTQTDWYVLSVVMVSLVLAAMTWVVAGKRERIFRLVRNDELAAAVLGVPVLGIKLLLFTIGGIFTGISGVLLFTSQGLISPNSVTVVQSVQLALLVVIGGTGQRLAGLVGAFVILWLQSALGGFGNYQLLVYGVVLLAVVLYLPAGVEGAVVMRWRRLVGYPSRRVVTGDGALPTVAATEDTAPRTVGDLAVRNAYLSFGSVVALEDVSIDVRAGSVTAVIGANGAGKSTLVNVISGIERLDRGTVSIGGDDLEGVGPAERTRRGIIRTFQVPRLVGELSALENIVVGTEASHRPLLRRNLRGERESKARAEATLTSLSLGHLAYRPAATLSTGERKYVELARAVFSSASVLLLDEPAVGLSADEVKALRNWLEQLRSAGAGILVIDHNIDFIKNIADHVYVMENGRVTWSGAPSDLATPDRQRVARSANTPESASHSVRGSRGAELSVTGLSAGYGQITVIREVSFTARAGEVLGIVGPNGAGKSTLLAAIAGSNPTARGQIALDGKRLERMRSHERLGAGVALVPEGRRVIGSISVEANLAITEVGSGRARSNETYPVRRARVYELFPRLAERAMVPGAVLSGGEQQMLAIARALMTSPDVLLLDEPSQGLSPSMVDVLTDALARLAGTMTIVVVEQNMTVLDRLADRTVRMSSGALVTD